MNMSRNVSATVNQGNSLSGINNEAVIQILGLDGQVERNRLLDDIVTYLELDRFNQNFTPASDVVQPATTASVGFDNSHGYQVIGTNYAGLAYETPIPQLISYVDLSPPLVENSPNYAPESYYNQQGSAQDVTACVPTHPVGLHGGYMTLTSPTYPHEVISNVHTAPAVNQGTNKPARGKASRRKREPTPKKYQCEEPLSDPEEEKKRVNAIMAKKNRDKKKNRMEELEKLAASLSVECGSLRATNKKLKNRSDIFGKKLMTVCQQFNVPVMFLPQE